MSERNYRITFHRIGLPGSPAQTVLLCKDLHDAEKRFYKIFPKKRFQFKGAVALPVANYPTKKN